MTCKALLASTIAAAGFLDAAVAQTSVAPPPTNVPSSVQLYGIGDVGLYQRQLAGETRLRSLQSGGLTTSRWGITGNEDLGGGLRAIFDLSSFVRVDTGESGRSATDSFFGRYSYVGLSSAQFGAVRLGRISTATFLSEIFFGAFLDSTTFGPYLLQTYQAPGGQPMIPGNGYLDSAWSNSVSYTLPAIAAVPGLIASVQAAAAEGTGGRRLGGGISYRGDTFGGTFTMDNVDHGALPVGAPTAALATAARPQYTANRVRTYQGGAYYDFKVARVWAQANQTTFSNATAADLRLRTYALSGTVPFGTSSIFAEWSHTTERRNVIADQKRDTEGLGYDYFLSKRTDIYAVALHDKVTNLKSGNGGSLGLRHRF